MDLPREDCSMARKRQNPSANPPSAKTNNAASGNQPARDYRAIVHSIDSITKKISASNKANDSYQQDNLWWNKRTAIAVGVYTFLTLGLVILNKCAIDATRESFTAVQRAFIVVSGMKTETKRDVEGKTTSGFTFAPIIRNSGNTPTKDMEFVFIDPIGEMMMIMRRNQPIPHESNPADPETFLGYKGEEISVGHYLLGPHDDLPPLVRDVTIDSKTFDDIISGRVGRFFYGAVRYYDVFEHTPQHITKYCFTINNFKIGPGGFEMATRSITAPGVTPYYAICGHWNCSDDECDGDKRRYESEMTNARQQAPTPAR
jgi:hypothetical protein